MAYLAAIRPQRISPQERITQVWFAGVHANVGGGYADDGLAHVPLIWILCEAKRLGLRFSQDRLDKYIALADENGPITDSRHGLAGYYRYNPRRIDTITKTGMAQIPRTKIHESVKGGSIAYRMAEQNCTSRLTRECPLGALVL